MSAKIAGDLTVIGSDGVRATGSTFPWLMATGLVANADNRATIQTQWDAAATAGRGLSINTPGTYLLTKTGTAGSRYCLKPGNAAIRYALQIGPGVVLKLADGQAVDADPIAVIRADDQTGGVSIGWWGGGLGGRIDCNARGQSGWTGGWTQINGNYAVLVNDTLDAGSSDVRIEHLHIYDNFSDAIFCGHGSPAYGRGGQRYAANHNRIEQCAEGILFGGADDVEMIGNECIRVANKVAGDDFEPAYCRDFRVQNNYSHTNGLVVSTGGASVDVYCSRRGVISGNVSFGTANGITLESDFGDSTRGYCDDVVVTGNKCDGRAYAADGTAQTIVGTIGLIPAQGGRSVFTGNTFRNYATSGCQFTPKSSAKLAWASMTGNAFENSGGLQLDVANASGQVDLTGCYFTTESPANDNHITIVRSSGSNTAVANIHGCTGNDVNTSGIYVTGNSGFAPTGSINGFDCGARAPISTDGTALVTGMSITGLRGILALVRATTQNHMGRPVAYWDSSQGDLVTLAAGSIYQELDILFIFEAGNVKDKVAHGSGNIRLSGGANKTFPQYGSLSLRWVNQTSEWYETGRSG